MNLRDVTGDAQQSVSQLIDKRQALSEQRSAIDAEIKAIGQLIEKEAQRQCVDRPKVLTGQEELVIPGEANFDAVYKRGERRTVQVKKLYKKMEALFWRLADVGVGDLEKTIGRVEAQQYILLDYAEVPTLRFRAKKNPVVREEEEQPQTRPQLRSVA